MKKSSLMFYGLIFIVGLSSLYNPVLGVTASFRVYLNVLSVIVFAFIVIITKLIKKEKFRLPLLGTVCLIFGAGIFSSVYAHSPFPDFLRGLVLLAIPFLDFYLVVNIAGDEKERDSVLGFLVVFAFVTSLIGIFEYFFSHGWIFDLLSVERVGRIGSIFNCPGSFAGYLILIIPVALGLFLVSRQNIKKAGLAVFLVSFFLALMWTYTRSAWIGLFTGLVVFSCFRKKPVYWWLTYSLIVLVFLFNPSVRERLMITFSFSDGRIVDIYPQVLLQIKAHPIIGSGLGVFARQGMAHNEAHNMYLEVILKSGILGFAFFALFFYRSLKKWFRLWKTSSGEEKIILESLLAGIIAYMVQGMFESMFFAVKCNWVFMMFLAFLFLKQADEKF